MRTLLFAGVAVAGFAVAGLAQTPDARTHVMMVRFPNGAVGQIEYVGDVPPRVVLAPQAAAVPMDNPFAMMERMSAAMDRQAAALLQAATAPVRMPADGQGFGFASTMSGSGVCSRSISITYAGNGAPPHVVSSTSGDCGSAGGAPVAAPVPAAVKPSVPTIEAKASGPVYAELVRPVSDRQD